MIIFKYINIVYPKTNHAKLKKRRCIHIGFISSIGFLIVLDHNCILNIRELFPFNHAKLQLLKAPVFFFVIAVRKAHKLALKNVLLRFLNMSHSLIGVINPLPEEPFNGGTDRLYTIKWIHLCIKYKSKKKHYS